MNKIYSTVLLISTVTFGFSQSNTVSSGGNASGSGGSLSYTVGQIDYSNQTGTSGNTNQGVQQPFEIYTISSSGLDEFNSLEIQLYPNPTSELIILHITELPGKLTFNLFDMAGKLVSTGIITEKETIIDAKNYAPGEYHLSISQQNEQIQSFKIIKNQ